MSAAGASFRANAFVCRLVAAGMSVDVVRRAIERSDALVAVNQADRDGETPMRAALRLRRADLVVLLLEHGAEMAADVDWFEVVVRCVDITNLASLRRLLELGAVSVDVARADGYTALMHACSRTYQSVNGTADRRDLALEIFRRSSAETRRAVCGGWGGSVSAADHLIWAQGRRPAEPWRAQMIVELLAAGAPVRPENAARFLPTAAVHGARREAELVACKSMAHDWRAHETFVRLSLDMGELREAQRMVAERRARLEQLEWEMGAESGGDSSGSGSESDESDEDEAMGSLESGGQ